MGNLRTPAGSSISWERIHLALPDGLLLGALLFLALWLFRFRRPLADGRKRRNALLCLLFLYCGAVCALTLRVTLPAGWRLTAENTARALASVRWLPFESAASIFRNSVAIGTMKYFIRIIGGNFVMLLPLGILLPLIWPRLRAWQMAVVAVLVPLCIECLQLVDNILGGMVRAVEMEDLVLNACGCLLGYGFLSLFRLLRRGLQERRQKKRVPALIIWLPESAARAPAKERSVLKRPIKMRKSRM